MSKTKILYKDIGPGSDEDAAVTSSSHLPASDIALLPFGGTSIRSLTLEPNRWVLDGTFQFAEDQKIAFWSSELSGDDKTFTAVPAITVNFDKQYSSVGVSLIFDPACGEYCTLVNIKWYQGDTLKADVDFEPDGPTYFCNQRVEAYNKIVIELKKTSIPHRRARLNQIIFGIHREFDMTEIRSASIINETSLSGLELPISTMNLDIESKSDIDFMFQLKQPLEVYNNENLICVYYIDGSRRNGKSYYSIESYDAFGVLDEYPFPGGVYANKSAKELVQEIIGDDFDVTFDGVDDMNLTGLITAGTKREALQQVFFPWNVIAATDGGRKIKVFPLPETVVEIGPDQIYSGVSVETSAIVTEVRVTAHTYAEDENGSIEINGKKYKDTETVYTVKNPNVVATDKQNVVEATRGTLVSTAIGQQVAQRLYDYYMKRNTLNGKIVWSGQALGDLATLPNAWGGKNTGHIKKMEIKLSNTVAASVESLGV